MKKLNFYPYYESLPRSHTKTTTFRLTRPPFNEGDEVLLSTGWDVCEVRDVGKKVKEVRDVRKKVNKYSIKVRATFLISLDGHARHKSGGHVLLKQKQAKNVREYVVVTNEEIAFAFGDSWTHL